MEDEGFGDIVIKPLNNEMQTLLEEYVAESTALLKQEADKLKADLEVFLHVLEASRMDDDS